MPDLNRNILASGNGGRGGNGGTPPGLTTSNGGNGGNGGSTLGGGVFVNSGTTEFINDTIVDNEAFVTISAGVGGNPGDAGGTGGSPGNFGVSGTADGGGYYSPSATNIVGNDIIDLNAAGSSISGTGPFFNGPFVPSSYDVSGSFTSLGHNFLGSTGDATFTLAPGDIVGVNSTQLNLGPLQLANGGPTPTNALVGGSLAIDAGDQTLIPAGVTTDQRGPGFPRVTGPNVDVGRLRIRDGSSEFHPRTEHHRFGRCPAADRPELRDQHLPRV